MENQVLIFWTLAEQTKTSLILALPKTSNKTVRFIPRRHVYTSVPFGRALSLVMFIRIVAEMTTGCKMIMGWFMNFYVYDGGFVYFCCVEIASSLPLVSCRPRCHPLFYFLLHRRDIDVWRGSCCKIQWPHPRALLCCDSGRTCPDYKTLFDT